MSKPREFWIRDNAKEFGVFGQELGKTAFESPLGIKGKDGLDCELIHVIEVKDGSCEHLVLVEKIASLIETINAVQNKIGLLTTNSSSILEPVKDAWNINAAALCKFGQEQSEYLAKKNPPQRNKETHD